jgi:hypothetical protein
MFFTSNMFSSLFFLFPKESMSFPSILAYTLSPKVTLPLSFFVRVRNLYLSLVICF